MEINKTNTTKNALEIRTEMNAQGVKVENIYYDGMKLGVFGYANNQDKEAGIKALQSAIDGSDNIYDAINKLMLNANLTDNNVEPDEQISIQGFEMFISYKDKTCYDSEGKSFVNCQDLDIKEKIAIKEILTMRANAKYAEMINEMEDEF